MCGIFGAITDDIIAQESIRLAHNIQKHRGPDAQGEWGREFNNRFILLAHQRLAILDLSDAGNQPMIYQNDKGVLVYNGELYNYLEIRSELQKSGEKFNTNTDTEVLLSALHVWGPDAALKKFNGMWAFAWFDRENSRLILSRDRTGEKPLYYHATDSEIVFASEIKTLLSLLNKKFSVNADTVSHYLRMSLLNANNETFINDIHQLPAATYSTIYLNNTSLKQAINTYWSCNSTNYEGMSSSNIEEAVEFILRDAVRIRTRSDVPVGVLLSGGIDSSAISAMIGEKGLKEENITFLSSVSHDRRFDESKYIDMVSNHLKRPVSKVYLDLNSKNAFSLLDEITWYNDEPVNSFSNVAHFLLMKRAKELGVTVILSGQGADELFCGYKKYLGFYMQELLNSWRLITLSNIALSFILNKSIINQFNIAEAKRYIPFLNNTASGDICGEALAHANSIEIGLQKKQTVQGRQCSDIGHFSVPALNHYEDRMSMAMSREVRLPFLDYRLIDLAVPLAMEYKINKGWTKYILRKSIAGMLPKEVTWRKDKQGFVNPQSEWLKSELKQKVESYFNDSDSLIYKYRLVNQDKMRNLYSLYCKQKTGKGRIWFRDIFSPLALEIWLRKYENYIV